MATSSAARSEFTFMGATLGSEAVRLKVHFHDAIGDQSGDGRAVSR